MDSQPLDQTPARPGKAGPKGLGDAGTGAGTVVSPSDPEDREWSSLGSTHVLAAAGEDTETASGPVSGTRLGKARAVVTTLGEFRLVKKLGQGAMAAVYKARQTTFNNRLVALKVLFKHVAANPKLVERFYREARVLGRLDHPNMVQGYCVGEDHGLHYFAMEYVEGDSTQKWLGRVGRLPVADAVRVILDCARALEYAHNLDVIHRDIKPDNILITARGEVKLADLGMVKEMDEDLSLTQTGHAVGTPWYMPLEQARNAKDIDRRCDIYALGCTFFHLLTGRPPFAGGTIVDVIQAKELGTVPLARQLNRDVPERLDLILAKMAAKQPRYRYQTCAELIADLESLGLASERLTFLDGADAKPGPEHDVATQPTQVTAAPSVSAATPMPAPATRQVADVWYVRCKTKDGQVVLRDLSTADVLHLIAAKKLDPAVKVSRSPEDGYRALGAWREFEAAVLTHVARPGSEVQNDRYRALYQQIEEKERQKEEAAEQRPGEEVYYYWLGLGLKVGAGVLGFTILAVIFAFLARAIS